MINTIKYTVFNKKTKEFEREDSCIITQNGIVAFWDDSQGWAEAECQDDFEVNVGRMSKIRKALAELRLVGENNTIIRCRFLSIRIYSKRTAVDIAKGRFLPSLRGTYLPSFDKQCTHWYKGMAINWLGIRFKIDLTEPKGYPAKPARRPVY